MSLPALVWARLRHRPLRTLATVLGVAAVAGLASAALMVRAAGEDLTQSQPGEPLITMQAGRICPSTSHLDVNLIDSIRKLSGVSGVIGQLVVVSDCKISTTATTFRGVIRDDFLAHRGSELRVIQGDMRAWTQGTALIGKQVATARNLSVGDTLESAGYVVEVAAVVDGERMQDRSSVWVHRELLTERLPALKEFQTLFEVRSLPGQDIAALGHRIDEALAGLSTTAPFSQAAARVAGSLGEVLRAGGVVAFAAAIAGILLLINSTVLGLRSSAKDLGVLRAIGHGPFALAMVVGLEGAFTGLVGGLLGSGLAMVLVQQSATAISTEGISVVIDARLDQALWVIGSAGILGILASALPGAFALRGRLRTVIGGG